MGLVKLEIKNSHETTHVLAKYDLYFIRPVNTWSDWELKLESFFCMCNDIEIALWCKMHRTS